MERIDVAIIGAGAAGLTAAIFAARSGSRSVVAFDGAKVIGAKILVSGGSRCNVTHDVVRGDEFYGSSSNAIKRVLRSFTVEQTVAWFESMGVRLKREETGKLFPTTDRSRDVVAALLDELRRARAEVRADHRIVTIEKVGEGFELATARNRFPARRVILATGGKSLPKSGSDGFGYELARSLGHSVTATTPALVPLLLASGHWLTALSGVAMQVELRLELDSGKVVHRDEGSLLLTHFGLSGPLALDVSRHWLARRDELRVVLNFVPGETFESVERDLQDLSQESARTLLRNVLLRRFTERFVDALLRELRVDRAKHIGQVTRDERRLLVRALTSLQLPVTGDRGYNFAEVTAGGVPLAEIDPSTMQSKVTPGIYFCGEILDVDGRIGGYNFQWAWASGRLAGMSAARA